MPDVTLDPLAPLLALRQHQRDGKRSPHKPLLVLMALGKLATTGSSALQWSQVYRPLANLIGDFGPPSRTGSRQTAAYPFTRLRVDGVWLLDAEVPMARVTPLHEHDVVGRLAPSIEAALRDPVALNATARALVEAEFPPSLVADVLTASGFNPDLVYGATTEKTVTGRRRNAAWPTRILTAWDRQCAFCGFDGQLGNNMVGLEAAHIRWFNFDGPDELDNGLALCALHHKLFDRGVLGLSTSYRVQVSTDYTARTDVGRMVYELADRELRPRAGTPVPNIAHLDWHTRQVFKGLSLSA